MLKNVPANIIDAIHELAQDALEGRCNAETCIVFLRTLALAREEMNENDALKFVWKQYTLKEGEFVDLGA